MRLWQRTQHLLVQWHRLLLTLSQHLNLKHNPPLRSPASSESSTRLLPLTASSSLSSLSSLSSSLSSSSSSSPPPPPSPSSSYFFTTSSQILQNLFSKQSKTSLPSPCFLLDFLLSDIIWFTTLFHLGTVFKSFDFLDERV